MTKLVKGKHTVETSLPREVTELKSHGYKVVEADNGGSLPAGTAKVTNKTGRSEAIVPASKTEAKK